MTPLAPLAPLTPEAAALLAELQRSGAFQRGAALRDSLLAQRLQVPERNIIDLARELLDAGYLVCATCQPPHGRFFVRPGDAAALSDARHELEVLEGRGRAVFERAQRVRDCIARYERSASVTQPPLFAQPAIAPHRVPGTPGAFR